jgi:hypothetical protein
MRALRVEGGRVHIELSADEMVALINGLNEASEAISEHEFATRMGVEPGEVRALMAELKEVLRRVRAS